MTVERAAEVIRATIADDNDYGEQCGNPTCSVCVPRAQALAQALVDAGWHDGPKLSDVDRAVLDAARYLVVCAGGGINDPTVHAALADLCAAVETPDEYAARWETQP